MTDHPDPDNPLLSIAYVLGHIARTLEAINLQLDDIAESLAAKTTR